MDGLPLELFKQYGGVAIIAAIALGMVIWLAAHIAAKPGTQVSVLWGLVTYTKISPVGSSVDSTEDDATATEKYTTAVASTEDTILSPIQLKIIHGITLDGYNQFIEQYAAAHNLRQLRPLETGRDVQRTPTGTYFFVSSTYLGSSRHLDSAFMDAPIRREGNASHLFQVSHVSDNEFMVLAFVSETDADRMQTLPGTDSISVTLAPIPWESFTTAVPIPFDRFTSSTEREIDIGNNREFYLLEAVIR